MPCSSSSEESRRETTKSLFSGFSVSIKRIILQIEALSFIVHSVIGLVGVFTKVGVSTRFAQLLSVVLGIGIVLLYTQQINIGTILIGLVTGLTATGTYAGVKTTVKG